ncbi:ABI3 protein, partial [Rhinopomastus cyanomelas]|nr:ABI3 protein [Rhinopomastus cyanomelas]
EQLRQRDGPEGRRVLRDHHCNLLRVADYCESNYLEASDKRKALEETMALSTQSLASVTYQISSLATTFLRLLDLQTAELRKVEADVSCLAQEVDIHKEKVSRREIGSLTTSRRFPLCQKVVSPSSPPCLEPYYRKPLNFSVLDDIGHGMKDQNTQLSHTGTLAWKGIKSSAHGAGTLRRSTRVPEPIQPPMVPEGKLSAASSTSSLVSVSSCGAPAAPGEGIPAPRPPVPPPPGPAPAPTAIIPPAPPLPGVLSQPGDSVLPPLDLPPPAPDDLEPLPPPPEALPSFESLAPPPSPAATESPWAPESYLEKVVTLYPYMRQKDNELSFQPGTILFVRRRYSDGWCEGLMGDQAGFFPSNYVEPL